ncbi:DUF3768 domain-containing protein [Kordia sp. TARA_039_SRF]|nr:DUF3768 domain-containing protein [Kordia sp. TARA_039_SRF]
MTDEIKQTIAKQNDLFRQNFADTHAQIETGIKGRYLVTRGISELPVHDQLLITKKVREFNDFNPDNDPYGEHDMGSFKHNAETIFWKIDYYDTNYQYGSPEPSNLNKTRRVLTVMQAHEY